MSILSIFKKGTWWQNALLRSFMVTALLLVLFFMKPNLVTGLCNLGVFTCCFLLYGGQNKGWWRE